MTRRKWARRMVALAAVMLVVGLALMVVGAVMAGKNPESPMGGVGVGMIGVFLLACGGLAGKFAIAGPYPNNLEAEA